MTENDYEHWCKVVEVSEKRYRLELLVDENIPRVPPVEGVLEYLIGMTSGAVLKGGSRAARAKDWYGSTLHGKSQAEIAMPLAKQGALTDIETYKM